MKRLLDIVIVLLIAPLAIFLSIFVAIAIKLDSPGPVVYWSTRVGQYGKPFQMPKFRSMAVGAPVCEAEKNPETQSYITKVGAFIRKTSLDELPQLWCVLKGDMSLIGPRPVLPIVTSVLEMRKAAGVDQLKPGISGWAQVNGRTTITDEEKVALDTEYLHKQSVWFDLKIMALTILKVLEREDIVR